MLKMTGNTIDLKCTEQMFPEFPELLFGRQIEGGATLARVYFDASKFAESKGLPFTSVEIFLKAYEAPISAIIDTLKLPEADMCRMNTEGHVLIESSLLYLFISFVEPRFLLYIFDRMDELFATGFTVSDTYLLSRARVRLPMEVLTAIKDDASQQ